MDRLGARRVWLALVSLVLVSLVACAPGRDPASGVFEEEVGPGRTVRFTIRPADDGPLLVWVEQHGIDLALTVSSPTLPARRHDQPFDRSGAEAVWLPGGEGPFTVTLEAHETGAPAGRFRLVVLRPPGADQPLQDFAEAGRLYAEGSPESLRKARDLYRRAAPEAEGVKWLPSVPGGKRLPTSPGGQTAATFPGANSETAGVKRLPSSPGGQTAAVFPALALQADAVLTRLLDEPAEALPLARQAAERWRELGHTRAEGEMRNEVGLDLWLTGEGDAARAAFEDALALLRRAGADYSAAATAANLCLMELTAGRLPEGARCYDEALQDLEAVRAPALEAAARVSAGRAWDLLGEPRKARGHFARARELAALLDNPVTEAQALHNGAALAQRTGDLAAALADYDRALTLFRELEDRRWQARTLSNLGSLYLLLEDHGTARGYLEEALAIRREIADRPGQAHTLDQLARAEEELGEEEKALALYREALTVRSELEDPRGLAWARHRLGRHLLGPRLDGGGSGETRRAAERELRQALETLGPTGDRLGEARVTLTLSAARLAAKDPQQAHELARRALDLLAPTPDDPASPPADPGTYPVDSARAHVALARADARLGRGDDAEASAREALALLASARAATLNPELRTAYTEAQQEAGHVLARLLLDRGEPAAALAVVEGLRARGLAEALAENRTALPSPLLAQRQALLERLDAKADALTSDRLPPAARQVVETEERDLLRRLDLLEGRLRTERPRDAAWSLATPQSAAALRALLDPGTAAAVYALGDESSWAWVVTAESIRAVPLPPAADIADRAQRVYELLFDPNARDRVDQHRAVLDLADAVLAPITALVGEATRLVVVPDGPLHYIPFEALPYPASGSDERLGYVLDRFDAVTYLSSLTALAVERETRSTRSRAARPVVVLADPVFDPTDPRVGGSRLTKAKAPVFSRLPGTRREALAVADLAPGDAELLLGLDARRERVVGDALAPFRVVHFATHGLADPLLPERSGLALSRVDADGRSNPGMLRLRDVYGLRLGADLVVLSGCRTAYGRELRGEGLQGLARGFQYAGAPRVVASLWPVPDHATGRLMTRFYEALWRDGADPAAALTAARRSLRSERRTRDPFYWAGFLHLGDARCDDCRLRPTNPVEP